MTYKQKQSKTNRSKRYIAIPLLLVVALATALTVVMVNKNQVEASPSSKKTTSQQSKFSFDSTKVSGWRQGPTNNTSMALFANDHSCFTSIEFRTGTVDGEAELDKSRASLTKDGYTSIPGDIVTATLKTNTGDKQYELHPYSVSGSGGAGRLYGGQEFSYIMLSKGYLFVQGHCDTADQLATTVNALQAIKFDESK